MAKAVGVEWDLNGNTALKDSDIVVLSPDLTQLTVVININQPWGSTLQWAFIHVPLSFDGNSHSIVLDTSVNKDINVDNSFIKDIKDGTLYYSATVYEGKKVIALKLVPFSNWSGFSKNGDGLYDAEQIAGDWQAVAGSIQNLAGALLGAGAELIGAALSGNWVAGGTASIATLVTAHPNYGVVDPAEVKADIINEITTKGFNEYEQRMNQINAEKVRKESTGTYKAGENQQANSNMSNMAMVAGLGLLVLLIIFVAKR